MGWGTTLNHGSFDHLRIDNILQACRRALLSETPRGRHTGTLKPIVRPSTGIVFPRRAIVGVCIGVGFGLIVAKDDCILYGVSDKICRATFADWSCALTSTAAFSVILISLQSATGLDIVYAMACSSCVII